MKKITTQKELDKITVIEEDTVIEGDLNFVQNIEVKNATVELRGKVDCGYYWLEVRGNSTANMRSHDESKANMRSFDKSTVNMWSLNKSTVYMRSHDESKADMWSHNESTAHMWSYDESTAYMRRNSRNKLNN